MVERVTGWRCIGCGRIDAPRPCVGVCQDRPVEIVLATDYDETAKDLTAAREEMAALRALVYQIAHTTPRDGQWEGTYRALQERALELLERKGLKAAAQ
jgi:predicted amino acid racemase